MTPIERLIATARAEIGYVEKATNTDLDSPTANPGDKNWTKFARDLDAMMNVYNGKKNGYAWCDIFVDWCFIKTFGLDVGMELLCQEYNGGGAGCTSSARYFKQKGRFFTSDPKPGDQIFFTNGGGASSYHTGLVVDVKDGRVYTIEGNTSSLPGVVENGGCVRDKSYPLTYSKIYGYGRPDFSIVPPDAEDEGEDAGGRYNEIGQMPKYAQPTIMKMVDNGFIGGAGTGKKDDAGRPADLNLSIDMIRVFVTCDRAGLYDT